jgi:hypothetical protein
VLRCWSILSRRTDSRSCGDWAIIGLPALLLLFWRQSFDVQARVDPRGALDTASCVGPRLRSNAKIVDACFQDGQALDGRCHASDISLAVRR